MKKIRALLIAGYALTLLSGCKGKEKGVFDSLEINELPKTTFYCGEEFSNTGITLTVKFTDGSSFVTEDVTTSKPSSMRTPGKQTIKAYYSNDEYDINTYVTYEINVIDWTKEEKAIFAETSVSTMAGVYYPKMEGMKLVTETDDTTGAIVDYWIELDNADNKTVNTYLELLDEYEVSSVKNVNGEAQLVTFKFYEQADVPEDFFDVYGNELRDPICYKYNASYQYIDVSYGQIYTFYADSVQDTLVVGLSKDNKMIVRYIANGVIFESLFSQEVPELCTFDGLYQTSAYTFLKDTMYGYNNEQGQHARGLLEQVAPMAIPYFLFPEIEPEVFSISNYASIYPWLHGEDTFSFEIEVPATEEEYAAYGALLESKGVFTKTTKQDVVKGNNVNVDVYTVENQKYVGNLVIEVTDYIPNGMAYTIRRDNGTRETVRTGCFRVYYRFAAPEVISPAIDELLRIYEAIYGEGNFSADNYDVYEDGTFGGLVKIDQFRQTANHPTKSDDEAESKEEALEVFVNKALQGYTVKEAAKEMVVNSITLTTATYSNDKFTIVIYSYFGSNGKYAIEFSIGVNKD